MIKVLTFKHFKIGMPLFNLDKQNIYSVPLKYILHVLKMCKNKTAKCF